MKMSIKILIGVAIFLFLLAVASLFVFRVSLQGVVELYGREHKYIDVSVEPFHTATFRNGWDVIIRQGRAYKLELADGQLQHAGRINTTDNLLVFEEVKNAAEFVKVRITTPKLHSIEISGGTQVNMQSYKADSLRLILRDSAKFIGSNNTFLNHWTETFGKPTILLTDDPYD